MASIHTEKAAPRRVLRPWALAVLLATAWSLVAASRGEAHVVVAPTFVDGNSETTIAFEMPNERPPHATVSLEVTAPPASSSHRPSPLPAGSSRSRTIARDGRAAASRGSARSPSPSP